MKKLKTMTVVKSNRLISAIQPMTLSEIRLLQLAIVNRREDDEYNFDGGDFDNSNSVRIHAKQYSGVFESRGTIAYETMKSAANRLVKREFTFLEDMEAGISHKWVDATHYVEGEGVLELKLSAALLAELAVDDNYKKSLFTSYSLDDTGSFLSTYCIRLYELLMLHSRTGKTPFIDINTLKLQLGASEGSYTRMVNFKKVLVEQPIAEINAQGNIFVTFDQEKKGRNVTALSFSWHKVESENQQLINS